MSWTPRGLLVAAAGALLLAPAAATIVRAAQGVPVAQPPQGGQTAQRLEHLGLLVPAYFHPALGDEWDRLAAAAARLGSGRLVAIANVFNGPWTQVDPSYAAAIDRLRAAGGRVIGYVYSSYAQRPRADVEADVDAWYSFYALDGILIDEMDNTKGASEGYYQSLFQHVQSLQPGAFVLANPGVNTRRSYLRFQGSPVVSALCIFEDSTGFDTWMPSRWTRSFSRDHFCVLPYGRRWGNWKGAIDRAWRLNAGWVDVTGDNLPNPWDTLPAWFGEMVNYLAENF